MTCRFTELIVKAQDPGKLAGFWCRVLGYHIVADSAEWVEIAPWASLDDQPPMAELERGAAVPSIIFVPVPEAKTGLNRLHLDILPIDRPYDQEVARVLALGARQVDVGQGDDARWVVVADPEGNEFCIGEAPPGEVG